jgi:hypothetical protein
MQLCKYQFLSGQVFRTVAYYPRPARALDDVL